MPLVDVIFVPSLLEEISLVGASAVVIDVLRATTTISVALSEGAEGVIPVATPEDAFTQQRNSSLPLLIGGERHGKPLPGFDFGNSPGEYVRGEVEGRRILLTTTNGTQALLTASGATEVWIASFLNRQACCEALQDRDHIFLVCSGKEGQFCLEDTVCAGAIIAQLAERCEIDCTDAACAAQQLYAAWEGDLAGLLHHCEHGRYLARIGLSDDLNLCAQLDSLDVNGLLADGVVGRSATNLPRPGASQ